MKRKTKVWLSAIVIVSSFLVAFADTPCTGGPGGAAERAACTAEYPGNPSEIAQCTFLKCAADHLNNDYCLKQCMINAGYPQ